MKNKTKKERHILALSGGKDSAALAVYLIKEKNIPNLEFVFCDTGHELPETYEYLLKIESILDINIKKVEPRRSFEAWLEYKYNYLPSQDRRWCTAELKIKPYEEYIGDDIVYSYIGLRADEDRDGYFSSKSNVRPRYPFREDDLEFEDIRNLLESSGLGFPDYYKWRSRSGCYFCFFQQKIEWLNLYYESEIHKKLFLKAMSFEKVDKISGNRFTWCDDMSLEELLDNESKIRAYHIKQKEIEGKNKKSNHLFNTLNFLEINTKGCIPCTS